MKMANHPRPGDIIQESLDELNVSLREFARAMEIAPSTASRLLTGKAALTQEMAIKLSVVIGSSPQMWLNLQNAWSLAEAEKTVDVSRLRRLVKKKKNETITLFISAAVLLRCFYFCTMDNRLRHSSKNSCWKYGKSNRKWKWLCLCFWWER